MYNSSDKDYIEAIREILKTDEPLHLIDKARWIYEEAYEVGFIKNIIFPQPLIARVRVIRLIKKHPVLEAMSIGIDADLRWVSISTLMYFLMWLFLAPFVKNIILFIVDFKNYTEILETITSWYCFQSIVVILIYLWINNRAIKKLKFTNTFLDQQGTLHHLYEIIREKPSQEIKNHRKLQENLPDMIKNMIMNAYLASLINNPEASNILLVFVKNLFLKSKSESGKNHFFNKKTLNELRDYMNIDITESDDEYGESW